MLSEENYDNHKNHCKITIQAKGVLGKNYQIPQQAGTPKTAF
jgi:hypothetical protein